MQKIISKYLKLNNYSDLEDNFKDLFLSHPDYPSLYAVTDSFDYLRIENIAAIVPKDKFTELPQKFMTFFKGEFVLISKQSDFISIEHDDLKEVTLKKDEFLKSWEGLVVGVEPNEKKYNKLYSSNLTNKFKQSLLIIIPLILLLFFKDLDVYNLLSSIVIIIGFLLSVLILNEGLGNKETIISNFCNFNSSVSCSKVISSPHSKINKWISLIDLPIIFYGSGFFSLFFSVETSSLIGFVSLFTIPLIIYTLWLQKVKLKKWCPLCLLLSLSLLSLGACFFMYSSISNLTIQSLIVYVLSIVMISLQWFSFKNTLEKSKNQQSEIHYLKKIKRNFTVFDSLSNPVINPETFNNIKKINFGNSIAPIKISLLLSPSCVHCHKAFVNAITLMQSNPEKIGLDIFFNINPNNKENPFLVVVQTLVEMNIKKSENLFEAISDWHSRNLELKEWSEKWQEKSISIETINLIQEYYEWCFLNNFNYAPVIIINQKLFPKDYELNDLKYFINDLIEESNN